MRTWMKKIIILICLYSIVSGCIISQNQGIPESKEKESIVVYLKYTENPSIEKIDGMLSRGANPEAILDTKSKTTPLLFAANLGYTEIIDFLLQKGANLEAKDGLGNTALMYAIQKNDSKSVKVLLKYDPDLKISNEKGDTYFTEALKLNSPEILILLMENGIRIDPKDEIVIKSYYDALENSRVEMVKFLLEKEN